MNKLILGLCIGASAVLAGCCSPYGASIGVGVGGIRDTVNPAGYDIDNSVQPVKCGHAESTGIILISQGDSSIKKAMDNGGIKKVHHVDVKVFDVFGIYSKVETQVWGE